MRPLWWLPCMSQKFFPMCYNMLLLLNSSLFFSFRRRKFSKGPSGWPGTGALALWGKAGGLGMAGDEAALDRKSEKRRGADWMMRETFHPGDRLLTEAVQSLSLEIFKTWLDEALISVILSHGWSCFELGLEWKLFWAPFQLELSYDLFTYSFAWPLRLIRSVVKLSNLFVSSPHLPVKSSNLFAILFMYFVLLSQEILLSYWISPNWFLKFI